MHKVTTFAHTGAYISLHSPLNKGQFYPIISSSSHLPSVKEIMSSFLQAKQLLSKV